MAHLTVYYSVWAKHVSFSHKGKSYKVKNLEEARKAADKYGYEDGIHCIPLSGRPDAAIKQTGEARTARKKRASKPTKKRKAVKRNTASTKEPPKPVKASKRKRVTGRKL